jgi:hypothetical protein
MAQNVGEVTECRWGTRGWSTGTLAAILSVGEELAARDWLVKTLSCFGVPFNCRRRYAARQSTWVLRPHPFRAHLVSVHIRGGVGDTHQLRCVHALLHLAWRRAAGRYSQVGSQHCIRSADCL